MIQDFLDAGLYKDFINRRDFFELLTLLQGSYRNRIAVVSFRDFCRRSGAEAGGAADWAAACTDSFGRSNFAAREREFFIPIAQRQRPACRAAPVGRKRGDQDFHTGVVAGALAAERSY